MKRLTPILCGLWLFLAATHFDLVYVQHGSNIDLSDYVRGVAPTPYQYRVLPALLIRALERLPLHPPSLLAGERFPIFLIVLVSICGAMFFTRATLLALGQNNLIATAGACILLYLTYFSLSLNYELSFLLPYDVPSLLFFSGCIYCLVTRKPVFYYVLFILGTFNRETTILLLVMLPFMIRNTRQAAAHMSIQLLLWITIKAALHHVYSGNPTEHGTAAGGLFLLNIGWNLKELVKPWQWPALASILGFMTPVFIWGYKRIPDRQFAKGSAALIAVWIVGMVFTANLIEVRVFTELNSVMAISLALIFASVLDPGRAAPIGLP